MRALNVLAGLAVLGRATPAWAQVDYARAEQLLEWNLQRRVFQMAIEPTWLAGDRLWYRVMTPRGSEFYLVDPTRQARYLAFDNARLAAAMSVAADTAYDPTKLPFTTFVFANHDQTITFAADGRRFSCDIVTYACSVAPHDTTPARSTVRSPDGRWEAFVARSNLFVRPVSGGDSIQLTTDGTEWWSYGLRTCGSPSCVHVPPPLTLLWSPDSRKIAVLRYDERNVRRMILSSSTTVPPAYYVYPEAVPGDSVVTQYDVYVIDVGTRRSVRMRTPATPDVHGSSSVWNSPLEGVQWSPHSDSLFFSNVARGLRRFTLMVADVASGAARRVVSDTSRSTRLEVANWWLANAGHDVIWHSTRDGWEHLYRFGTDGSFKNQITRGAWSVDNVVFVNDATHQVYFTARGREPGRFVCHAYLYRVNLDGTGLTLLTPEPGDHTVSVSPSGAYILDTYSRVDLPPVTVLRASSDGHVVQQLERADISRLAESGWRPPELFRVTAADGVTELYGFLVKPSHFDSTAHYPVIDHIYPGPMLGPVEHWGFTLGTDLDGQAPALAQLGFVVVYLQPRGTPWRGRAFFDTYQGHIGQNTLPDHVTAIQQLGARFRWMDLTRIGIYGESGGGFAAVTGILRYPDFYKVAVSINGNHDNRYYWFAWGEENQGLYTPQDPATGSDNYQDEANAMYAPRLRGALLLIYGEVDDDVHPSNTLHLVHALITAGKDFDMLAVPGGGHGVGLTDPYTIRRTFDYFVRHLLGEEPPSDYVFRVP